MKKLLTVLMMVLCCSSGAFAGEIILSDIKTPGMEVVSENLSGKNLVVNMNCSMNKLHFYDATSPKGDFTVIYTPEFQFGGYYGAPQLPVYTKVIQVPAGAECQVVVKSYDSKTYNLADYGVSTPVYPRQPSAPKDGSSVPFVYEKSAYVMKGYHGQQIATLEDIGSLRNMRLAHLTVSPVKYSAIDNKIVVYNNIDLEISFKNSNIKATKDAHKALWTPAYAWAEKCVVVPEAIKCASRSTKQTYLIISDPMFKDALKPFVDWKTKKGFDVEVVYTDQFGSGSAMREPLKAFIADRYNKATASKPAPSYVLFVGDHDQIPAFNGQTSSHITDLYYVTVSGSDNLPDILTGRFSAQTVDQLVPQIEKTIEYEKFAFPDPSYLNNVVLTAGWDGSWARSHGWPHINYAKKYYFNKEHGLNVNSYLSAGSQQNSREIVAHVSNGVGYVNYTAHGSNTSWHDPSFTISDVNSLKNVHKYCLAVGNCCITNTFQIATCFGESWLRAKDAGAIGYIGGTNSTYWDEDFYWGVGVHSIVKPNQEGVPPLKENTGNGAFEAMFEKGVSNAAFMVAGNMAVEESTSSRKKYYWEIYQLMGDPSVYAYIGQPQRMRVSHEAKVDTRSNKVTVQAPAGAYVGISSDGQLLGAGYSVDGSVEIELSSMPANGSADVVVTAANAVPYFGTITVAAN